MAEPDAPPLRILLSVHHRLERGHGAAGTTLTLADELTARGHDVAVIGLDLERHSLGGVLDAIRYPFVARRAVARRLELGDVDVIDASTGDLAQLGARRVRASSTAVFARSHGLEHLADRARREASARGELDLRWRYRLYHGGPRLAEVAASIRAADGVLVLNDAEAVFASSSLGITPSRVWRTAPLLDAAFVALPRAEARDVLVLGPCTWRKGGDIAVRALTQILRDDPESRASWAGLDDPSALLAQFDDDLRDRVAASDRFDPKTEASLLATHRVLLYASRFEGMPLTLLEALTAGISVVGSDIGGVRDLLGGGAGILVPTGHVEGFSGAARALLDDDAARASCGAAGARLAASMDAGHVVDDLIASYRAVLRTKRGEA